MGKGCTQITIPFDTNDGAIELIQITNNSLESMGAFENDFLECQRINDTAEFDGRWLCVVRARGEDGVVGRLYFPDKDHVIVISLDGQEQHGYEIRDLDLMAHIIWNRRAPDEYGSFARTKASDRWAFSAPQVWHSSPPSIDWHDFNSPAYGIAK